MTVELRPLGVKCNIGCQYCYQNPERDAGNVRRDYDMEKMKSAILEHGTDFTLFGGEPLLIPEDDLEELWRWGFAQFKRNTVQTNGTLINENHLRMFKAYNVAVGLSLDGPEDLNDVRWAGSLDATRKSTAHVEAMIDRLCQGGRAPSIIVTLHKNNATADKLPIMNRWFQHLENIGVRSVRLHILEVESDEVSQKYALSSEENVEALLNFLELQEKVLSRLRFDLFQDMGRMLVGEDNRTSCIWNACDPYTTRAVQGVEGSGQRTNCGRTNKAGIDFVKASATGHERQLALYSTAQEHGGCSGCRFFLMCKGNCPGTALAGDWRNRSEHCEVWFRVYERIEAGLLEKGTTPLSCSPMLAELESVLVGAWESGQNKYMFEALPSLLLNTARPDAPSRDSGHGDSHGDHTDAQLRAQNREETATPLSGWHVDRSSHVAGPDVFLPGHIDQSSHIAGELGGVGHGDSDLKEDS